MRIFYNSRVLLPLTICVGFAIVGVRAGDVWDAAASGRLFAPSARAETAAPASATSPATATPAAAAPAATPPASTPPAAAASTSSAAAAAAPPAPTTTASAPSTPEIAIPDDASPAEMEVLKQLSNRRQELDKRAQTLDAREDLLKIAEQRVDQKIKDMEVLRKQLQSMVNQVGEAQNAQLDNLVKIYETMKPGDAAKIFEALDMPVLLSVIQRMKPARTAPIMAQMAPEKAKEVTVALTKQDKLPQVK